MELTDQELRKLRDAYNVQKKTQARRKPDRNGHRIQVTMTFEEWLQVWVDSGQLHLRGNGRGKFCMARKNDLGDYAVGNVEIKACEENSREAKLGRQQSRRTRDKMSATRSGVSKSKAHKDSIADAHLALPIVRCPHCAKAGRQGGAMRRHHFERCKSTGLAGSILGPQRRDPNTFVREIDETLRPSGTVPRAHAVECAEL